MSLTEAVLNICETYIHNLGQDSIYEVDTDSDEYYSWTVDEADKMADEVFSAIDRAVENYMTNGNISPPPEKDEK